MLNLCLSVHLGINFSKHIMDSTKNELVTKITKYYYRHRLSLDFIGLVLFFTLGYYGLFQTFLIKACILLHISYRSYKLLTISEETKLANYELALKCWLSLGLLVVVEYILDYTLYYFPFSSFYYLLKPVFYLWMMESRKNFEKAYQKLVVNFYFYFDAYFDDYTNAITATVLHITKRWNEFKTLLYNKFKKKVTKHVTENVTKNLETLNTMLDDKSK